MSDTYTLADSLDDLFKSIRSAAADPRYSNVVFSHFLREHFGLDERDGNEYLAFARLITLQSRLLEQIDSLKLADRYKEDMKARARLPFDRIMQIGPTITLSDWHGNVSEQSTSTFSLLGASLAAVGAEYVDLAEEARALIEDLQASQANILESSLPSAFQKVLVDKIDSLIVSLRNVRIFGPDGIKDATSLLLGEVLTRDTASENAQDRSLLKRMLSTIQAAFGLSEKAGAGADGATKFLAGGTKLIEYVGDKF